MNPRSSLNPSYRFDFQGGISRISRVHRTFHGIDGDESGQFSFRFDDLPLVGRTGRQIPLQLADLLDVAASIFIADRIAPRERLNDPRPPHDRWHRKLHLVIPVREPHHWRQVKISECLNELLYFLTHDQWTIEFTSRLHIPRQSETQTSFVGSSSGPVAPVLHSGGLDSLFGIIDRLSDSDEATVMPVTVTTNSRNRGLAQAVVKELRIADSRFAPRLVPSQVHINFMDDIRSSNDRESSHRVRAMLFLAAGVASAVLTGGNRLFMCENGIGAINLPMTPDHWGPRATKAMHPKTLSLFAELSSLALEQPLSIHNLGLFATKGQLAESLIDDRFISTARLTATCDRTTYSAKGKGCGKCTSCILRRVALIASNLDSLIDHGATSYQVDWLSSLSDWNKDTTLPLLAMRSQVEQLRSILEGNAGFTHLASVFPELYRVVDIAPVLGSSENEVENRLVRLYRSYVGEFDVFAAKIDRPGWGRRASISELTSSASVVAS